ncbi:MAG: hypothetical protein EAZ95_14090 [Bacteroidetes bacterium]|nr:MAG: hypothetical protein EAZ95_14090 [Bacteroidota bacterium]
MLGHLKPKVCHTNPAHKAQYQETYCSICASLRREDHVGYSFLLNHELTLVMLALRPFLQGGEEIRTLCPAKAYLGTKTAQKHPAFTLAGKLSIVLGWVKVTDWATDRPRFYKRWLKNVLQRKVNRILPALPTQTQDVIAHYLWLTQTNSTDFEQVRQYSGLLSQSLVEALGGLTSCLPTDLAELVELFRLNGELIATADHLIDAEKDWARKEYNPILEAPTEKWGEAYYSFHTEYNRMKIHIYDTLTRLQNSEIASPAFALMLRKAIQNIDAQIKQNKPAFAELPQDALQTWEQANLAKADCGSCDCDCGGCDGCSCGDCVDCGECCSSCNCNCDGCGNCGGKSKKATLPD